MTLFAKGVSSENRKFFCKKDYLQFKRGILYDVIVSHQYSYPSWYVIDNISLSSHDFYTYFTTESDVEEIRNVKIDDILNNDISKR